MKKETEMYEFTRRVVADGRGYSIFEASHEIWNVVQVKFPQGYFGNDMSHVPQRVWIGIELTEPRT